MNRLVLAAFALIALATPAAAQRRYAVTDFDRIVVEGPFAVRLTTGRTTSAAATGSPQALENVVVDVQGTTLRVRRNRSAWGGNPNRPPEPAAVTLTTRTLRSARVLGSGRLEIAGMRGLRAELSVEGAGLLRATGVAADALALGLRGSGSLEIEGTAATLSADLQGSGSLAGERLSAGTATLVVATSGDVRLTARRAATVTANGLGRVTIDGRPACTVRGPGAAEVRCGVAR